MNILGLEINWRKKEVLQPVGGRWFTVFDSTPGAWQQHVAIEIESVLTFGAVFACLRLITTDIGKLPLTLMQRAPSGIMKPTVNPSFSPVLRKPNSYQTRIKFIEYWLTSKLIHGNAYILKGRDNRGIVTSLRVIDPTRVTVLVSESGEVFYRLRTDNLTTLATEITVPATEVIHDVHFCPDNPLVGVSPIGACGMAAVQGLKIQGNSQKFFANMSRPSGMLSAEGAISDETAARLKTQFEANYGGENIGKIAVAGDGLKFETFGVNADDAQLIQQLEWTAFDVCRAFGVPPYKIGVGPMPSYNNIEALNQAYYAEALQELIECIELLLDEGLELPQTKSIYYETQFDLDGLLRMDTATFSKILAEQTGAGIISPDEGRSKVGLEPVPGGKYPYLQQQNYSLEALAKRDAQEDPFGTAAPPAEPKAPEDKPAVEEPEPEPTDEEKAEVTGQVFEAIARKAATL